MDLYYTSEKNAQILIKLMKDHGIRKVIASPGTTDICLVASLMHDNFFEIYSSPEERSAGYMACGFAAESGEAVAIICTGATASRNYLPALTEAYYRKLPILAITCSRRSYRIGHNVDQVTDRTQLPKDTVKLSVQIPLVYDQESEWHTVVTVNKALLELFHRGNGPVHINLETNYSTDYTLKHLPEVRKIERIMINDSFPIIDFDKTVIFVGSHLKWTPELTQAVDKFCEVYNSCVLCDLTSNYKGKYSVSVSLLGKQRYYKSQLKGRFGLVIHIGDVHLPSITLNSEIVWRVNPDGELRDTFKSLKCVFEMQELDFFEHYNRTNDVQKTMTTYLELNQEDISAKESLKKIIDDLPFSNVWLASQTINKLAKNSELHLGIQNSLRTWNFFDIDKTIDVFSNVGGYGIDGSMSSVIGSSLTKTKSIYYCVLGDLAFFYDMNSLGNRHVRNNLRILLINNGNGVEFKLKGNPGHYFGNETDLFISAAGHYGNKSKTLVKHYAEDLGFKYLSAENKDQFCRNVDEFVNPECDKQPIIFEVFTNSEDEVEALELVKICMNDTQYKIYDGLKKTIKGIVGEKNISVIKNHLITTHENFKDKNET